MTDKSSSHMQIDTDRINAGHQSDLLPSVGMKSDSH